MKSKIPFQPHLIASLFAALTAPLVALPAIPEPPLVIYGQVSPASPAPDLSKVSFTLKGNSETLKTTTPARVVTIEGTSWFIVSVPFETRTVSGGPALTATPGTLALSSTTKTYTVSAKLGTATATLPASKATLDYGAKSTGLIWRIDLSLGSPTFAQSSESIFGKQVSPTADADGDGINNYEEYLAGTDPKNPNSRLVVQSFALQHGGGLTITWDTVQGRTYSVERTASLTSAKWTVLQTNIQGDGAPKSFTDTDPGSEAHLFYRIAVSPVN